MSSTHICVLVPRPSTNRPSDRRSRSIAVIAVSKGLRVWAMAMPLPQLHALGHCRAVPEGHERRAVDLRAEDPCQTGGFNLLRLGGQDRPGLGRRQYGPLSAVVVFHVVVSFMSSPRATS
jgi:hypothetical protein